MKKWIYLLCSVLLFSCFLCGCTSSFRYDHAEKYSAGEATITEKVEAIEIEWISGGIEIIEHSGNFVSFSEDSNKTLNSKTTMHYWLEGTTLHLKFGKSGLQNFNNLEKSLQVCLPNTISLNTLEIETVSADVNVRFVNAKAADIETVSGNIEVEFLQEVRLVGINSVSGNIKAKAESIGRFDVESTSGNVTLISATEPSSGEVETVSGNVKLYLPQTADFQFEYESVSGELSCEFETTKRGDEYTCGNGTNEYGIETVSGDVEIKKNIHQK